MPSSSWAQAPTIYTYRILVLQYCIMHRCCSLSQLRLIARRAFTMQPACCAHVLPTGRVPEANARVA